MGRFTLSIVAAILLVSVSPWFAAHAAPPAPRPLVPKPTGAITALAFSPNGRVLAIGRRRTVTLHDVQTRRAVRTLQGVEGAVTSIAFSANGSVLAAGSGTPGKDRPGGVLGDRDGAALAFARGPLRPDLRHRAPSR